MLRAHVLHRNTVCCPACRSADFTTYRRLPADEGGVINHCTCRRCGVAFQVVEDRSGRPVRS